MSVLDFQKVHIKDKNGRTVQTRSTRIYVDENKRLTYERPAGSGFLYDEVGTLIKSPDTAATVEAKTVTTETLKTVKGK